jgi:methyl-accepting chemotaxis protein/methyl-accepting chemotaxis protein-1 (serine sensor receptor)
MLGLLLVMALTVAGTGLYLQQRLGAEIAENALKTAPKIDMVNSIRADVWVMARDRLEVYVGATQHDPARIDAARVNWEAAAGRVTQNLGAMRELLVTEDGRAQLDRVDQAFRNYAHVARDYTALCQSGQVENADKYDAALVQGIREFNDQALALRQLTLDLVARSQQRAAALRSGGLTISIVLLCAVFAAGAVCAVVLYRANRDLVRIVDTLAMDSRQVAAAAAQVSGEAQQLSHAATTQAASIEESSASAQEVQSMTNRNCESSEAASAKTDDTARTIQETAVAMGQVVGAMDEIVDSSTKISKIIKVIDEIAFQTNILALNAAVEAARAGNAGMGFAVVADEVRGLSHRSAQAAKDTAVLIQASMQSSSTGRQRLDLLVAKIETLAHAVDDVKHLSNDVRERSVEQARGVEQISAAVVQLEQITQKIAANAEEGAAAGEELAAHAAAVDGSVANLAKMLGRDTGELALAG